MRYRELIDGLQIFARYAAAGHEELLGGAQHDIVLVAPPDLCISEEDKERLEELGFFISQDFDCWAFFT